MRDLLVNRELGYREEFIRGKCYGFVRLISMYEGTFHCLRAFGPHLVLNGRYVRNVVEMHVRLQWMWEYRANVWWRHKQIEGDGCHAKY